MFWLSTKKTIKNTAHTTLIATMSAKHSKKPAKKTKATRPKKKIAKGIGASPFRASILRVIGAVKDRLEQEAILTGTNFRKPLVTEEVVTYFNIIANSLVHELAKGADYSKNLSIHPSKSVTVQNVSDAVYNILKVRNIEAKDIGQIVSCGHSAVSRFTKCIQNQKSK